MALGNEKFAWKLRRKTFYAKDAHDVIGTAGADIGGGAGAPVVTIQGGAGVLGAVFIGADADEVHWFIPVPWDWDTGTQMLGRVFFCHSATDADTPVFTIKTKFHAKQATVVDMDTADDKSVAFDAHTCSTTAESLEMTDWADLEWDAAFAEDDAMVGIILICTTMSGSANEIELLGFQLMYEANRFDKWGRKQTSANAINEQPV